MPESLSLGATMRIAYGAFAVKAYEWGSIQVISFSQERMLKITSKSATAVQNVVQSVTLHFDS